jgi:nucleoside-triphosphatase THEP1
VIDLVSQEKRRLAKRRAVYDSSSPTPKWDFDSDVLAWGNQVLEKIVGADLLLIDELGPLELLKGKGWQAGIRLLEGGSYRVACVVVRRELLNVMLARFPNAVIAAELTREEGDQTTSDSSSD